MRVVLSKHRDEYRPARCRRLNMSARKHMLRTLDDLQIKDRRVLVRADLNVPVKDGKLTDDQRIRAAAPTIREIVERGSSPVVMSHLGKPIARHIAKRTREGHLTSVAGGGETGAALVDAGVRDDFTYVSLAGGAFLEWLEGKDLPGLEALHS
jgi:3-phosphoglycerate kinase